MSWIPDVWSATAAVCLTLAGAHFLLWVQSRSLGANLLLSIAASSVAACAGVELALMHAQTLGQYGAVLRWFHLPVALIVVWLAWFARQCLRAGRLPRALLVAGMLAVPSNLPAQTGLPSAEPGFAVFSWDSGGSVPGKFTTAMARTPDGYLWIGTQVGLIRFDGVRFVTLTTNTTPALGDNRISSLLVDRSGVLWVATQGATLSRRQAGELFSVPLDGRMRGVAIESLAENEGGVWLVTDKWGLVRVANGVCDFSNSTTNLSALAARSMVRLANGEWWAMAEPGLLTFNGGTWEAERFGLKPGIWFWALAPTRQGSGLWLATEADSGVRRGGRVFKLEGGKVVGELAPYPWRQDSSHSQITSIVEDGQGRVWVGTELGGAFCWQREQGWRELKTREGRSYIQIREFLADSEGLLWMATRDEMLHRIEERLVATVELPPGHAKDIILSACITRDGTLWAGTEDAGVFRFRDGHFRQVTNGLSTLKIGVLFADTRTNLWVGTRSGLWRWQGDNFQSVPVGTTASAVYALYEDRGGNLWVGNGAQVIQLSPDGQAQAFGADSGLGDGTVVGLAEDIEGRIYASKETAGLFRLNGGRFETIPDPARRFGAPRGLWPDEDGSVWISTQGKGLHRLYHDQFQSWGFEDGLPNDYLRSVVPDDAGNLWFSASKGIFGCAKRALLDYQRGKTPPVLFWRLGELDGMEGAWTYGLGQPVAARSADGRLWFPNRNVVAVIDPKVVTRGHADPPPLIEEVVADGVVRPRRPDGTLLLLSGARQLEVHYTCPDLQSPEVLRFRYRLEGLEDHWVEAGNRRVAHYGQLQPGEYRFRVMVGNQSGEWKECEAPLVLSLLPRWWEKTSVRILGLLSITGVLMGTTWRVARARQRRRLEKLELQLAREKSEAELQTLRGELAHVQRVSTLGQLSTALAHELNQPLGAILSNADAAEMLLDAELPALDKVREILADIRKDDERAGEVIRRMRALLRRRELAMQRLDVNELVQSVLELVKADALLRGTAIRPELGLGPLPTRGDRVHLQQVLLNLIVNGMEATASLPSPERCLSVRTGRNAPGDIEVAISDNGPGISPAHLARLFEPFFTTKPHGMGMGIAIARTIIQAHHGRICAENNPGGGATFRFTLPFDEEQSNQQDSIARAGNERTTTHECPASHHSRC